MPRVPYTIYELDLVRDCFNAGWSDIEIASLLCDLGHRRNSKSIENIRATMGLRRTVSVEQFAEWGALGQVRDEIDYEGCNEAFVAAMTAAIKAGSEHVAFGIVKDETPFVGRLIHPEPALSGCGSSASLCAEAGLADRSPSQMAFL